MLHETFHFLLGYWRKEKGERRKCRRKDGHVYVLTWETTLFTLLFLLSMFYLVFRVPCSMELEEKVNGAQCILFMYLLYYYSLGLSTFNLHVLFFSFLPFPSSLPLAGITENFSFNFDFNFVFVALRVRIWDGQGGKNLKPLKCQGKALQRENLPRL